MNDKIIGLWCASIVAAHRRTSFFTTSDCEDAAPCPALKCMISVINSLIGMTGSGSSASSATGISIFGCTGCSTLNEQA
jgi:hypothetical protein